MRVVKESSVSRKYFGWRVEVVRGTHRRASRNLLYHSPRTLGAHPPQMYAWHVTSGQFPNVRELDVTAYPVTIRVELIDPAAEGDGPDSRLVSGEIRVSWTLQRYAPDAPFRSLSCASRGGAAGPGRHAFPIREHMKDSYS